MQLGGFRVDLRHQHGGPSLPLLQGQVLPAGKGGELQGLAGRVLEGADVLPAAAGAVLLGAVEPPAFQDFPLRQGLNAVDAGPNLRMLMGLEVSRRSDRLREIALIVKDMTGGKFYRLAAP